MSNTPTYEHVCRSIEASLIIGALPMSYEAAINALRDAMKESRLSKEEEDFVLHLSRYEIYNLIDRMCSDPASVQQHVYNTMAGNVPNKKPRFDLKG